ncbi:GTPase [Paraburkholderia sp. J67]|uniref:GTPase n=1 Tax=Paraburkholderia sp. J67 TaxID=2805435 RepID=UPI002ABE84CF|nr:GTPase [Paraburkholderia sp. J67]
MSNTPIAAVLPHRAHDLARLQTLARNGEPDVTITVIGKYNHGKSRLLNELIGQDVFAVADRRETVQLADTVQRNVRWLDAPGLDADVGSEDDRHAFHAAWLESDIRLFVHAAKEGELDAKERELLLELHADGARTQRQTVFVLTQIDQLADDTELDKVREAIVRQAPGVVLNAVSATRHRKGVEGAKLLMQERSGIPALQATLDAALGNVPQARAHERALLLDEIRAELNQFRDQCEATLASSLQTQLDQRQAFDSGLQAVIEQSAVKIETMLDSLGEDHAIKPDTAKDAYALTAGKLERAHIQIAYSRACIEIDGFLAGHGVVGLPGEQQTAARSLNSVMIAVLGVSVKFRKDLRRMFCEAAGRTRLQEQFTHYYELSADRQALVAQIEHTTEAIAAIERAFAALPALEPRT